MLAIENDCTFDPALRIQIAKTQRQYRIQRAIHGFIVYGSIGFFGLLFLVMPLLLLFKK